MLPAMFPVLFTAAALAADPIALEVVSRAQEGLGKPGLTLIVNQDATSLDVRVDCGGAWAESSGGAKAGDRISLELGVPVGVHNCKGSLSAVFTDGSEGEMPLSFQVTMLGPLKVSVPRDRIDMQAKTLEVVLDRQPAKVEVLAYGPGDALIGQVSVPALGEGPGQPLVVQWQGVGEVMRLHVIGYDTDGFWSAIDLLPWYYDIPHEDVVFDSGNAIITPLEEPKLQAALTQVNAVLAKYGSMAEVRLYVAGYTDTVGDKNMNQSLSQQRAAAIARWFRNHGFEGEIYYQGFGEAALAVSTPDNTDEPANRRALYVLAAEQPPISAAMPKGYWTKL